MNNSRRTVSRIKAMIKLYQCDLLKESDNIDTFDDLLRELDTEEMVVYDKPFSDILYLGVLQNQAKIDFKIALYLEKYPLDRLSFVDRALLRIGTYELMFTDTPVEIIINEIINISKDYSEVDGFYSSKFNNGVLDRIAKDVRKVK